VDEFIEESSSEDLVLEDIFIMKNNCQPKLSRARKIEAKMIQMFTLVG
jgi:hypothetical protein